MKFQTLIHLYSHRMFLSLYMANIGALLNWLLVMIPYIVLVNEILKNEKYRAAITVLKGFRNGAV